MIDSITAITLSLEMIVPVVFIDRFILFDKDVQRKMLYRSHKCARQGVKQIL